VWLVALWSAVTAWPWSMVAAIFGIAAFSVLIWVNFIRPHLRRRRVRRPGNVFFIVPAKEHHGCDYAIQDDCEHHISTIVLPANTVVTVDMIFQTSVYFNFAELSFGCDGVLTEKPYAIEYLNRFVEIGDGKNVIPGKGNKHYIDKYHYYHLRDEPRHMSVGVTRALAFKIKTGAPGSYRAHVFFFGDEVEAEASNILMLVEETPNSSMQCVCVGHRRLSCAKGIRPL
jgi:hypothetical protein